MEQTFQSENYSGNAAANYQKFFVPAIGGPVAEDLLAIAHLEAGESVLDVACGTGVVTRLAAAGVGKTGKVSGLDLNPGMLQVARSETRDDLRIEWIEADAEAMPLDDVSYDVAFCQLGLQFMRNKLAALREMHRVLAPGGRVHVMLVGPKPRLFGIMADGVGRHFGQDGASFIDLVFSMHDVGELRHLFESIAFGGIVIDAKQKRLTVPPPREFLWQYIHSTPLVQKAMAAEESVRDRLEQDVCSKWEEFVDGGNMQFDVGVTTISAVR